MSKKKSIKFITALIIVLFAAYYIVGQTLGVFNKTSMQNAEGHSSEIINAYGIILPDNTQVKELNFYHSGKTHYCVAKIEYTDIDKIIKLNQFNTKTVNAETPNEIDYVLIDKYSELKKLKFALYENRRFLPQKWSVTLFYDKKYIYLSVDLEGPFGTELQHLFQKAEKDGLLTG